MFGYIDTESTNLVKLAPVGVGERLNASKTRTATQLFKKYDIEVMIINQQDQ